MCVECGVDREVHATAGQEASATGSFCDRQPRAKQDPFYTEKKNALIAIGC